MSEPATLDSADGQQPQEGAGQEPKVFDAEYVEKLRKESAKYRTEAKANADAATRLAEIEEANKTEAQKTAERLAAAEQAAAQARSEALRLRIAAKHGINDEHADLYLTGSDEETLTRQAKGLADLLTQQKKQGNHVPREGNSSTATPTDERTYVRNLFGSGD